MSELRFSRGFQRTGFGTPVPEVGGKCVACVFSKRELAFWRLLVRVLTLVKADWTLAGSAFGR